MAQSAETLYRNLLKENIVHPRRTPQDYRLHFLYVLRLIRDVIWADLIHVQIAGIISGLNAILVIILARAFGKGVIVAFKGGKPASFLQRYNRFVDAFFKQGTILVTTMTAASHFRKRGYNTWVIPNAVEIDEFAAVRRRTCNARIIVCRHLEPIYNIPMTLLAFRIIRKQLPNAKLKIIGDGLLRNELRALAQSLTLAHVEFQSALPHLSLPAEFANADMLLNPTNATGIPVSLVEAAAAGLVVVSVDSEGIREFICHGVNGFLVPPDDHEAMGKLAAYLLQDRELMAKVGMNARKTAAAYSWRSLRTHVYALYRSVLESKRAQDAWSSAHYERAIP